MTGTDPDPQKQKPIDRTQAYRPGEAAPPPLPDNLPKIPGITLHYEIARGGMGVVYSGRQDFLDRRVAVKLLSVELGGESFVQRFQREAKILAGVKHPNIVACHMAGQTDDGQSYLVMEFIDGPSLKKWITDYGCVPIRAALRTTRAVAQALGHAHTLGIIHRDVKPENILLETVTSTALDVTFPFTPKVVDLGLARASSGSAALGLTSPGSVMGTPATMSPEQFDEPDAVDFRSDIYGLGCALYEMLVGAPAFRGKRLSDIVTRKRDPIPPDPCRENADVPAAVGALVQSMLATNREDRPGSYRELDEQLVALIDTMSAASLRTPKPIVGEDTEVTVFRRPTQRPVDAPAATPPAGTKPPAGTRPPANGGPGILRTAEINFLAEGLEPPPAAAGPAFQTKPPAPPPASTNSGPGLLRTAEINFLAEGMAPPAQDAGGAFQTRPPAGTVPPAAAGTVPPPVPARSRTGLIAAAALGVLVVAGVAWVALKPDNDTVEPKPKPDPQPVDPKADPKPGNRPPLVVGIKGDKEVAVRKQLTLVVEASDPDGDSGKLSYAWTFPSELVRPRGATDKNTVRFEVIDGLPDVTFVVACRIRDADGAAVDAMHEMKVTDCPVESPWIGCTGKSTWEQDRPGQLGWTDLAPNGYLSCSARADARWLRTTQEDESYWEWFGLLESDKDEVGSKVYPYATLGLRLEIDTSGWAVVCRRSEDGQKWSIEIETASLVDGTWKTAPTNPRRRLEWDAVGDQDDPKWGSFSLQRNGRDLILRIGHAVVPEAGEPVEQIGSELKVPLAADIGEQKLTFFVDKGIGRFRVKRR